MSGPRFGLQARFALGVAAVLAVGLALLGLLLMRQSELQREAGVLGRNAVHDVATDGLKLRGTAAVQRLSDALANPLYYSDLDAIRAVLDSVIRQPDVSYALVFGADGLIIHDGSRDIADYGMPMVDPLAAKAVATDAQLVQWSDEFMDVSQAIHVGDQRLGGVRVGYSLASQQKQERRAADTLQTSLGQLARRHVNGFLALLAALAVLCFGAVWYVQRTLVTPIRQLVQAARAIGAGEYDSRLPASQRTDEVGELVRAFAQMGEGIANHNRDVRRMAYTDALTGLVNRLAFQESLERSLSVLGDSPQSVALLFLDLDGFKDVNDALGHDAGDAALVRVAAVIRDATARFGGAGALAARFGGDEFVVLLESGDVRAAATAIAEQLVQDLRRPLRLRTGQEASVTVSIGIALFPQDATDSAALLKSGDTAMYHAKVAGKNCWRFHDQSMRQGASRSAGQGMG